MILITIMTLVTVMVILEPHPGRCLCALVPLSTCHSRVLILTQLHEGGAIYPHVSDEEAEAMRT